MHLGMYYALRQDFLGIPFVYSMSVWKYEGREEHSGVTLDYCVCVHVCMRACVHVCVI